MKTLFNIKTIAMKKIFFYLFFCMPFVSFSQKIEVDDKTHEVKVDGKHSFNIERGGCGFGMPDCHFNVFDTEGTKVMRINYRSFNSLAEITSSNKQGTVDYYEFIFLASKTKAEITYMGIKEKALAKTIIENNLMSGGKLNDRAVEEFVLVHGAFFSNRPK
jgi:hypothetical protein